MQNKLLVVGGNGFVGSYLTHYARTLGMHVYVIGTAAQAFDSHVTYFSADIGDSNAIEAVFKETKPDYVINTAAVANIDFAEAEQSNAFRINTEGARICAELSVRYGARYLFFSSDAVFDGEQDYYTEDAATAPCNYYGKTKELAEHAVMRANQQAIIVRVSLLLGRSLKNTGVIDPIRRKLEAGEIVYSSATQTRTPIDATTLAEAVLELLQMQDFSGLIHLACTEATSKLDLFRKVAFALGYDPVRVQPYTENSPPRVARHRNGVLSVEKAMLVLKKTKLRTLDETIARAICCKQGSVLI